MSRPFVSPRGFHAVHTHVALGPLTKDELRQFFEDGYVIKHNLFAESELEPAVSAISEVCHVVHVSCHVVHVSCHVVYDVFFLHVISRVRCVCRCVLRVTLLTIIACRAKGFRSLQCWYHQGIYLQQY